MGPVLDRGPIIGAGSSQGPQEPDDGRGFEFELTDQKPFSWASIENVWMYGSFYEEWDKGHFQISSLNSQTNSLRTVQAHSMGAKYTSGNQYYYYNIPEEVDMPGEWYLDSENQKIYIYPLVNENENMVYTLMNDSITLFQINGANRIVFNGLNMQYAEMAVDISDGDENIIQNCSIKHMTRGVVVSGKQNGCIYTEIDDIVGYGVTFKQPYGGNDFANLIPENNYIQNCIIADTGGMFICYSIGTLVSHNVIHSTRSMPIAIYHSAETVVEYNEFTAGKFTMNDCGMVYINGSMEGRGNHIRYNYFHNKEYTSWDYPLYAIYFDDLSSDNYAYGNVIQRGRVYIHSGSENVIYNNIIRQGIVVNDDWYRSSWDMVWSNQIKKVDGIFGYRFVSSFSNGLPTAWSLRYPSLLQNDTKLRQYLQESESADYQRGEAENYLRAPKDNYIANNIADSIRITTTAQYSAADAADNAVKGWDTYVNSENGIKVSDGIYKVIPGFEQISSENMGMIYKKEVTNEIQGVSPIGKIGAQSNQARLQWESPCYCNSYTVIVAKDSGFSDIVGEYVTYDRYVDIDGLQTDTVYYWKVEGRVLSQSMNPETIVSPLYCFATQDRSDSAVDILYTITHSDGTESDYSHAVPGDKIQIQLNSNTAKEVTANCFIAGYTDDACKSIYMMPVQISAFGKNNLTFVLEQNMSDCDKLTFFLFDRLQRPLSKSKALISTENNMAKA